MYKGSCLCKAVEYAISDSLGPLVYCHCGRCRKANGAAFSAVSTVATKTFRFTKGQKSLCVYQTAEGVHRIFCGTCGSPILSKRNSAPETLLVRIGTLDTPLETKVSAHIFVGSKVEWDEIIDEAPQYDARP